MNCWNTDNLPTNEISMTAESDTAETEPRYLTSGKMLPPPREEARRTEEDVVADTRLTLYNARALENDDFKRLPSDTVTRGYLRIYAKLLKLDVESLVAAYEQTRRDAGLDPEPVDIVELNRRKPNSGRPLWYFIASIVVVLVLLWILSVWFLGNDGDTPVSGAIESVVEPDTLTANSVSAPVVEPSAAPELPAESDESLDPGSTDIQSDEIGEAESVELPPSETTQPAPLDRLELTFTDECWLVLTDAQGDVPVTDSLQTGRPLNLQGQAPFEDRMGNAHAVQLSVNGTADASADPASAR